MYLNHESAGVHVGDYNDVNMGSEAFRVSGDTEKKIRVFTFRISKPLVPPEITEDDVDFSLIGNENSKVKGFGFDFSYVTYSSSSGNETFSH